jgi:DNA-binding response OmpR family regulator
MKLLHVDSDQAYVRNLQNELLRSGGLLCELDNSANLFEAQQCLKNSNYDAVIMDSAALGTESYSAVQTLHGASPQTPIVVLTALNSDSRAIEAVAAGASDYLVKEHCQPMWLMRRVRYAIERSKSEARREAIHGPHTKQKRQAVAAGALADSVGSIGRRQPGRTGKSDPSSFVTADPPPPVDEDLLRLHLFHVLHVEDDPAFLRLVEKLMENAGPWQFAIQHVDNLAAAAEQLQSGEFDLVLLDLSLPDSSGAQTLSALLAHAKAIPIVVLTGRDDDASAIKGMQLGAEDYLTKTEPNLRYCSRAAQLAVTRRQRVTLEELPADTSDEAGELNAYAGADRREHPRYLLSKPIFAIPILPDGSPAEAYGADGFSLDLSLGGMNFEIGGLQRLPTKYLLVGIEAIDTVLHFAVVEARRIETTELGLRIGAQFANGERDLIRKENLEPNYNPQTNRYELSLSLDTISKWVEFGIFRATLVDRVLICPQCQAMPSFRNGCRVCGSVRLHSRPLIHHFACAHVGYVSDFEQDGAVVCPKCRTRNLIVGADYEHLNGPYRCLDCDWSDTELELVGQCIKCEYRFPMHEALEEDLIGYHVHRLDSLALINAT